MTQLYGARDARLGPHWSKSTCDRSGRPLPVDDNTVVVEKVVDGPVPPGAVFEVEVTCQGLPNGDAATEGVGVEIFRFDENGDPIGVNSLSLGQGNVCTVVETVTNGASVSYACDTRVVNGIPAGAEGPPPAPVFVECVDSQTVHFYDISGAEATFTVTNTFEEPPPPDVAPDDVAADVVAATPPFTG